MKTSLLARRRRWYHSASLYLWMARAGPPPDPTFCFPFPFPFSFFRIATSTLGAAHDY